MKIFVAILFLVFSLIISTVAAEEPGLPAGLGEPSLPMGLSDNSSSDFEWDDEETVAWQINGFAEGRFGLWRKSQNYLGEYPVAEARMQLSAERAFDAATVNFSVDVIYDNEASNTRPDLDEGRGWIDLRIANVVFSPQSNIDIRVGRQTLTWGTGDLIFINDLFPKDWNSFLVGRDNAYLKAPSDVIKVSLFSELANLDVIYTPLFDSDRYINGERVSYYNASLDRIAGTDAVVTTEKLNQWFADDELALRLYRNVGAYELALYGYTGYWKSPGGVNVDTGKAIFPRLSVYGASFRGPLMGGIINGEWGYYRSLDDSSGDNPFINNSEFRALLGYEQELISNLTLAMQFYGTRMLDYDAYLRTLPGNLPSLRQNRYELSSRLTWMMLEQKLIASLFLRYSPSDNDYYFRPKLSYSQSDHWSYELGANLFYGDQEHTFFGQFKNNDNGYVALRYGF